jgi:glutamate synthase domain-containing protein 1
MSRRLQRQGLYDPAHEHDACGVGFVANVSGEKSHDIVDKGLEVLVNLEHRGACGCDPDSGDGAGLTVQLPDAFLRRECEGLGIVLPEAGRYAVGMVFLDVDPAAAAWMERCVEQVVADEGQGVLGWRDVPHDPQAIGPVARESLPRIRQIFVEARGRAAEDQDAFERKLYVIRRIAEKAVWEADPVLLPRRRRSCLQLGTLPGPFALQHQHARRMGSRPPVPVPRPQR